VEFLRSGCFVWVGDGVMGTPSAEDILVRFSSLPITRCLLRLYRWWSPGRLGEVFGAARGGPSA